MGKLQKCQINSKLHQSALWYTQRGFAVFPLLPKSKKPLTEDGFKSATTDKWKIDAWWDKNPNANIGIATGLKSKILVLDVDHKDSQSAIDVLADFESQYGSIPTTPHVLTGGGGLQFYFRISEAFNCKVGLVKQVDIRSDGGYVVAPPSIHPNGKEYLWDVCHKIGEIDLAEIPTNLVEALKSIDTTKTHRSTDDWIKIISDGASEGLRNDTLAKLVGYLFRIKIHPYVVHELAHAWNEARNKPPLDPKEVTYVVESIASLENRRLLGGSK